MARREIHQHESKEHENRFALLKAYALGRSVRRADTGEYLREWPLRRRPEQPPDRARNNPGRHHHGEPWHMSGKLALNAAQKREIRRS